MDENLDGMDHTTLAWLLPDWAMVHLDLGEYERVDEYCREIAESVSADGEELNTRVVAHLMRLTIADATNSGASREIATAGQAELREAYRRWPDDFGIACMFAWNLVQSQPSDTDQRAKAKTLAQESVSAIANAGLGLGTDFRVSFPYHIMGSRMCE